MASTVYSAFANSFEEYFEAFKSDLPARPANLYEPVKYFLNLDGKRIRPLLALIANDCFNGDIRKVQPAAAAIELFHNFSLIHDDIMDNAPLRRGHATIHEKWNRNIAILGGDVLLVKAYQELMKCERALELQLTFSRTAIEVCEGQQMDMDFETRGDVTIEQYLEMIKLKTAVLLACSLQMGALCAGATEKNANGFYSAGIQLGFAFQLTDDQLDVFGKSEKTGKQSGGDIIANKKTWLLIKALSLADPGQKKTLNQWMAKKEFNAGEKVQVIRSIFQELELNELLGQAIDGHYQRAFADLRMACPDEAKTEAFISFIKTLMRREK